MSQAADIARRAAEIQQERGHCKGNFRDAEGRVCLWGALNAAAAELGLTECFVPFPHVGWAEPIARELRKVLSAQDEGFPGASFNDRPSTDERDVAKVLLQVADRLEIGGVS